MRRLLVIVALLMTVPGVASAGGGGDLSLCSGFATGSNISMLDSCFNGVAHFAPTGTLTVSNDGQIPHTFTAVDGSFGSDQIGPGEVLELTIDDAGIYQVYCSLHGSPDGGGMAGVLVVGEAEPATVAAAVDISAIQQAVADENLALVEAVDRQTAALGNLTAAQATLRRGLEVDAAATTTATPPAIVTVPAESTSDQPWVPLTTGVAAGLGVAALLVARRPLRETNGEATARPGAMVLPIEDT